MTEKVDGAATFRTSGQSYDDFMGRYSQPLAVAFADTLRVCTDMTALDIGCGPGALTRVLVRRLGAAAVRACDPSPPFVQECVARCPGVDVRPGRAEAIPFEDDQFDVALAQLVLHFVSDPSRAAAEMRRVLRPGGWAGACVWDSVEGMQMLGYFWDAARSLDPASADQAGVLRLGGTGEIAELLDEAGFRDVAETTLTVTSTYTDFDELWRGFLAGIGPAGAYCTSLSRASQRAVRREFYSRLEHPQGAFSLSAVARCAYGRKPGSRPSDPTDSDNR